MNTIGQKILFTFLNKKSPNVQKSVGNLKFRRGRFPPKSANVRLDIGATGLKTVAAWRLGRKPVQQIGGQLLHGGTDPAAGFGGELRLPRLYA